MEEIININSAYCVHTEPSIIINGVGPYFCMEDARLEFRKKLYVVFRPLIKRLIKVQVSFLETSSTSKHVRGTCSF